MLREFKHKIERGYRLGYEEAVAIAYKHTAEELASLADDLRKYFTGDLLDTCSIMNARSGRCQENCKWCSQSKFHKTDVEIYPLVGIAPAVAMARYNAERGVRRFSLVTSGRSLSDADVDRSADIFRTIEKEIEIELCASMGLLDKGQLQRLYDAGVRRYHCNLETAPSYFEQLCTTHTIDEKIRTIKWAQEVGMEVCSGGIIGMGETMEQRIELALALRELGIRSVPVNVLNPIKGTPLENMPPLSDEELLKSMAMFRIINPEGHVRFAGGRVAFKHLEKSMLHGGVSASIVGDMLTTSGSGIDDDMELFRREGFVL